MTQTEAEAVYDRDIAPLVEAAGEKCRAAGISFAAVAGLGEKMEAVVLTLAGPADCYSQTHAVGVFQHRMHEAIHGVFRSRHTAEGADFLRVVDVIGGLHYVLQ